MKIYEYTNKWLLVVNQASKTCQAFFDGASFVAENNVNEHIVFDTEEEMKQYVKDNRLIGEERYNAHI